MMTVVTHDNIKNIRYWSLRYCLSSNDEKTPSMHIYTPKDRLNKSVLPTKNMLAINHLKSISANF